jgi:hypothetical protein
LFQALSEKDNVRRVAFCENFVTLLEEAETHDSYFISHDEVTFHLHGIINKQNMFIWETENPDAN